MGNEGHLVGLALHGINQRLYSTMSNKGYKSGFKWTLFFSASIY